RYRPNDQLAKIEGDRDALQYSTATIAGDPTGPQIGNPFKIHRSQCHWLVAENDCLTTSGQEVQAAGCEGFLLDVSTHGLKSRAVERYAVLSILIRRPNEGSYE